MRTAVFAATLACLIGLGSCAVQHMFLSSFDKVLWARRNTTGSSFWSSPAALPGITGLSRPRRMSVCRESSSVYYLIVPYYVYGGTYGVKRYHLSWRGSDMPVVSFAADITPSGSSWSQPFASMCPDGVVYITDQGHDKVYKVSKGSNTAYSYVSLASKTLNPVGVASDQGKLLWSSNADITQNGGIYETDTSEVVVSNSDVTEVVGASNVWFIDTERSSGSVNPWVWWTNHAGELYKKRVGDSGSGTRIVSGLTGGNNYWLCPATDSVEDQIFISEQYSGRVYMVSANSNGLTTPSTVIYNAPNVLAISVYNSDAALPTGTSLVVLLASLIAAVRLMF